MDPDTVAPAKPRSYWSFIALVYSLLGWALFGAWLFSMSAGVFIHLFAAIPGATLIVLSALRPSIDAGSTAERETTPTQAPRLAGVSYALLYILGSIFGALVLGRSLTLLGIVAVLFTCAPWARFPFARHHFALSCVITMSGFVSVMAIGHRAIDTMFLPLAAWVFWLCSCCALLSRAEQAIRAKRGRNAPTDIVKTDACPVQAPG